MKPATSALSTSSQRPCPQSWSAIRPTRPAASGLWYRRGNVTAFEEFVRIGLAEGARLATGGQADG